MMGASPSSGSSSSMIFGLARGHGRPRASAVRRPRAVAKIGFVRSPRRGKHRVGPLRRPHPGNATAVRFS